MTKQSKKQLTKSQQSELLTTLKNRFEKNKQRHVGIDWSIVQEKLESYPDKLWSINEMEITGGEPDIIGYDKKTKEITYCDCASESPQARRSLCYDEKALDSRKENKPKDSALHLAENMGIDILSEADYRALQELGNFDLKTSSWIVTPANIRKLGGALFCDRRYNQVFVYHNGAESYYAARGFRGKIKF